MSKDLFLNILIVLLPVLLYQVYHDRTFSQKTSRPHWVIGIFCGLSAILCMEFPFVDGYGVWWDFRSISLTIAVLYGGWTAGLLATVMEVAYRSFLGNGGALFSIAFTLTYLILPFSFASRFYRYSPKRRQLMAVGMSLVGYLTLLVIIAVNVNMSTTMSWKLIVMEKLAFLLLIGVLQLVTMALSSWLIESMIMTTQLRSELQRSEKLSMISEMAASVAHEIRNPLTVVRGFLQLLSRTADGKNQEFMKTAISELDRAEFIISDYLNFAKPQLESVELFDASQDLGEVLTLIASYAALHGVTLEQRVDSPLWVNASRPKLKQAIINLLKNAIEACSNGGSVLLRAAQQNGHVQIEVIDSGEGMSEEQINRLGQPFYSMKDKGTGLGLMVTFRIIEAMDGKLLFQSQKGVGTQATILLPTALRTTRVTSLT